MGRVLPTLVLGAGVLVVLSQSSSDASQQQFLLGIQAYQSGALQHAHDAFSACLELQATRTDCMTNLASVLVDMDRPEPAEELYRAVLSVEPNHLDAGYNLAMMLQQRRTEPDSIEEAVRLYTLVISADPGRWDAWANLAAAASDSQRADKAFLASKAYQKSIVLIEKEEDEAGDGDGGTEERTGYLVTLYYGLGMQLSAMSDAQCAAFAADPESLLVGVSADGLAEDGSSIRDNAVCIENAQNALRTAVNLDPSHTQAEHMLAALMAATSSGADAAVSKASAGYVKALFDDFSESFDEKLASLGYVVPQLLGEATASHVQERRGGRPFLHALDAGCGTGLAGPYLRPIVRGVFSCVDLSPKMLEHAVPMKMPDGQKVFDVILAKDLVELERADILPERSEQSAGVELVAAADVLVYFGALEELLRVFAQLSSPSSTMIFSCERVTPEEAPSGWRLGPSGRFAHTKQYVVETAATAGGFELVAYTEITPRMEYGKPVLGHLFVFSRGSN
jgi:predicted TPR repeat methyltransferase